MKWVGAFGNDHLELEGAMSRGKVRKDLYYRLDVVEVVPACAPIPKRNLTLSAKTSFTDRDSRSAMPSLDRLPITDDHAFHR
jgi:hypothetical protein